MKTEQEIKQKIDETREEAKGKEGHVLTYCEGFIEALKWVIKR